MSKFDRYQLLSANITKCSNSELAEMKKLAREILEEKERGLN